MSFQTWHNYGYGICVSDIDIQDVKGLGKLLTMAPNFRKKIRDELSDAGIKRPTVDDYMDWDVDYNLGLATILKEVIEEAEGISMTACNNYDGEKFLLFQPQYPWELTDSARNLTEERLKEIFDRYVCYLMIRPIPVEYQEVENGG